MTDRIRVELSFQRENPTFVVGTEADGSRRSFRKQDIVFSRQGEKIVVEVDRKRYERMCGRISEKAPMAARKSKRLVRKCLNCRHPFNADPVTFICTPCKKTAAWQSGGEYSLA